MSEHEPRMPVSFLEACRILHVTKAMMTCDFFLLSARQQREWAHVILQRLDTVTTCGYLDNPQVLAIADVRAHQPPAVWSIYREALDHDRLNSALALLSR